MTKEDIPGGSPVSEMRVVDYLVIYADSPHYHIYIFDTDMSYVEKVPGVGFRVALFNKVKMGWEVKPCFSIDHCLKYLQSLD